MGKYLQRRLHRRAKTLDFCYICRSRGAFLLDSAYLPRRFPIIKIGLFICHAGKIRFTRIAKGFSIGVYRSDSAWSNRKVDFSIRTRRAASIYSNGKVGLSIGPACRFRCLSNRKAGLSIVLRRSSLSNRKIAPMFVGTKLYGTALEGEYL